MSVLIGCEESGTITSAMRSRGIEAYSCDLLPTRGNPAWHIQGDVIDALESRQWSMAILHPVCTALSLSGNRWYGVNMPRHKDRLAAIDWTINLWAIAKRQSDRVALENPASVIFKHLNAEVQYIQPWQFGHGETKKTGLALHNLPRLKPTNIVEGREARIHKMPPGPNRQRDRSKTYQGIADAIADQWGTLI